MNGTGYPSKEQKRRHGDLNLRPSGQLPNALPTELRGRGFHHELGLTATVDSAAMVAVGHKGDIL